MREDQAEFFTGSGFTGESLTFTVGEEVKLTSTPFNDRFNSVKVGANANVDGWEDTDGGRWTGWDTDYRQITPGLSRVKVKRAEGLPLMMRFEQRPSDPANTYQLGVNFGLSDISTLLRPGQSFERVGAVKDTRGSWKLLLNISKQNPTEMERLMQSGSYVVSGSITPSAEFSWNSSSRAVEISAWRVSSLKCEPADKPGHFVIRMT
ncbi:beta/gamma crystallin domain-containing protein [Streptomyces sp. NPDC046909]|uniref:beta/gamma crystallin domain-containing protein n=1 Tax=Streptomyces sp. NPDC046909 TaxID=3155617 RepID=UPI003410E3B3